MYFLDYDSSFVPAFTNTLPDSPYLIDAKTNPLNKYGKHKALAELVVQDNLKDRAQIIRFASLVSRTGKGNTFIEKISQRARAIGEISVVEDLKISIATTTLVVNSVIQVSDSSDFGIYHAVHKGIATWFELAKLTLEIERINAEIQPISHLKLNLPAVRPKFSALQPSEALSNTDVDWKEAVTNYLGSY